MHVHFTALYPLCAALLLIGCWVIFHVSTSICTSPPSWLLYALRVLHFLEFIFQCRRRHPVDRMPPFGFCHRKRSLLYQIDIRAAYLNTIRLLCFHGIAIVSLDFLRLPEATWLQPLVEMYL